MYEARLAHQIGHLEHRAAGALRRAEWIRVAERWSSNLRRPAEAEIARRGLGDPGPLLGMSLLSMTKERYALLQERDRKADELRELRGHPAAGRLAARARGSAAWRREAAAAGAPADDAGHRPASGGGPRPPPPGK